MFGGNEYWWAGLLVFVLFIFLNVAVRVLRNKPELSYAIAWCIAAFLLVYKIGEYTYFQARGEHMRFPVEFSAVSYFVLGIFITFRIKKADQFALFTAVLAGCIYSMSFWISPDGHINQRESIYLLVMAAVNHHMMYFAGMLMLANVRSYSPKSCWQQLIGVSVLVAYSWTIHSTTDFSKIWGKPIIIQITDGSIISQIYDGVIEPWMLAIYFFAAACLFVALLAGFYFLNGKLANRRKMLQLPKDYFPAKFKDTFKFERTEIIYERN